MSTSADKINKIVDKIYKEIFANVTPKYSSKGNSKKTCDLSKYTIDSSVFDNIIDKYLANKTLTDFDKRVIETLVILGDLPKVDVSTINRHLSHLNLVCGEGVKYQVSVGVVENKINKIAVKYIYG